MISSALRGAGGALVPVSLPDWYRGPGSGVYNRGVSNTVVAHAGNTVYRSPLNVVSEPEAGSRWPGDLTKMMFLPDGRLVPGTSAAVDMFQGADVIVQPNSGGAAATALRALVPAAAMFAGGYAGYRAAGQHKMWGLVGGAVVGGILGAIFK